LQTGWNISRDPSRTAIFGEHDLYRITRQVRRVDSAARADKSVLRIKKIAAIKWLCEAPDQFPICASEIWNEQEHHCTSEEHRCEEIFQLFWMHVFCRLAQFDGQSGSMQNTIDLKTSGGLFRKFCTPHGAHCIEPLSAREDTEIPDF
jgi:hypothetical protein